LSAKQLIIYRLLSEDIPAKQPCKQPGFFIAFSAAAFCSAAFFDALFAAAFSSAAFAAAFSAAAFSSAAF